MGPVFKFENEIFNPDAASISKLILPETISGSV